MLIHATLVRAPGGPPLPAGTAEELVIDTAVIDSAAALRACLSRRYGPASYRVGGVPLETLAVGWPPLADGAVIVAGGHHCPAPPRLTDRASPNLVFVVHSGHDAGQLTALGRGTYLIGRTGPGITICDPELSRVHATLTVGENNIVLRDNSSVNGSWVDGVRVSEAVLTVASTIRLGASLCGIALLDQLPPSGPAPDLSEPLEVRAPVPATPDRLMPAAALLPLVLGVVLALVTGMWFFLAFSALSAVTGLVPLLSGARRRRAFAAALASAVNEDRARRRRAAPDAGTLALAAYQPTGRGPGNREVRGVRAGAPAHVRLGQGTQPALVTVRPAGSGWSAPLADNVPVTIPLNAGDPIQEPPPEVLILGPTGDVLGLARFLLLQLGHCPWPVVCAGLPDGLAADARFLPGVRVLGTRSDLDRELRTDEHAAVLLFGPAAADAVPAHRSPSAVFRFVTHSAGTRSVRGTTVVLGGNRASLWQGGRHFGFQADFVSARSFSRLARTLGGSLRCAAPGNTPRSPAGGPVPDDTDLSALAPSQPADITGAWAARIPGLAAPIGVSAAGPLIFNLVADGPHLLVAGTTGSGKSELLRTLVLGIALHHPPSSVNFLFIDFKGGSGLGALAGLPHSVGLLTDLSREAVARALISLGAEVKRRERLFALYSVTDIAGYPAADRPPLPRLVVVIDEFRMLADDVPGSAVNLMRIAMLGRSLGIHLVMATQRPQGAVTADIRANVTASIALRVQSAVESLDVIGSGSAAGIPVDLPGRAFLTLGAGPPTEFQSAATGRAERSANTRPGLTDLAGYLQGEQSAAGAAHQSALQQDGHGPGSPVQLIPAIVQAARTLPPEPLHHPVLPVLPVALAPASCSSTPGGGLGLGLLDLPEDQVQHPLIWSPTGHSHLALVGHPAGGTSAALRNITACLLQALPERHLYVLDGEGSLQWAAPAPQVGAYIGAHEPKRAARVLQRISELIADRLALGQVPAGEAELTVAVSGWGRWAGAFRSSRWSGAEEYLQDVARDGGKAGVALVISGERELLTGRCFPLIPNRMYFPLGAAAESTISWPRLPAMDPVPGRCLVQGSIGTASGAVGQLVLMEEPRGGTTAWTGAARPSRRPFRVEPLPDAVSVTAPADSEGRYLRVPVGVGGDELHTAWVELPRRCVFLVLGGRGSGRTGLLDQIAATVPAHVGCIRPGGGADPAEFWKSRAQAEPGSAASSAEAIALVDDADQLPTETQHHLGMLAAAGHRIILAVLSGSAVLSKVPLALHARSARTGIVLAPRQPADGEFFGVRLECEGRSGAGRGFLFNGGEPLEVQVALRTADGA